MLLSGVAECIEIQATPRYHVVSIGAEDPAGYIHVLLIENLMTAQITETALQWVVCFLSV